MALLESSKVKKAFYAKQARDTMTDEPRTSAFPAPQPVLRRAQMLAVEQGHATAQPALMERAGAAAAQLALTLLKDKPGEILIAAGPGNNGGDAFVVARLLRQAGHIVVLAFAGEAEKLPVDARAAFDAWCAAGGSFTRNFPQKKNFTLVIDGLFGSGLARAVEDHYAEWVARLNLLPCPMLSLDIPSGLDADSGQILGCAVRATHTASFIALKPGLLTLDGPDQCGIISVHTLGLEIDATAARGLTVTPALFATQLKPRAKNSHKGLYGSAGIIGGARGMVGAALLAGRAALKLGAGRVYIGLLDEPALQVDPLQPELMLRPPREIIGAPLAQLATCLAIGPGLSQRDAALNLLRGAIASPLPLVLDADALNLITTHPILTRHIAQRKAPTLLTPHPAEAARLLGCVTQQVQDDRIGAALELAKRFKSAVVLKGCGSVIALADGRWFINTTGNAGMAASGQGDVLTGIACALLAQGWHAEHALLGAVHVHGAAADECVAQGHGPIGLTASETIDAARQCLNRWRGVS